MTNTSPFPTLEALLAREDVLSRLLTLLERIDIDPVTGIMRLQNGAARIDLHRDGTIRLHGTSIVQRSERDITLDAAWIDLN